MSETRDKRRRTDLDLFVLALIDSGVSTPYEFQKAAGLSPGATIPALQRLLEAGSVRQGKPGSRGRTNYSITPAGRKFLKSGWRILIEDGPSGDLDADLRVALLALWAGGKRQLATDFLQQSAMKKLESIESVEAGRGGKFRLYSCRLVCPAPVHFREGTPGVGVCCGIGNGQSAATETVGEIHAKEARCQTDSMRGSGEML